MIDVSSIHEFRDLEGLENQIFSQVHVNGEKTQDFGQTGDRLEYKMIIFDDFDEIFKDFREYSKLKSVVNRIMTNIANYAYQKKAIVISSQILILLNTYNLYNNNNISVISRKLRHKYIYI